MAEMTNQGLPKPPRKKVKKVKKVRKETRTVKRPIPKRRVVRQATAKDKMVQQQPYAEQPDFGQYDMPSGEQTVSQEESYQEYAGEEQAETSAEMFGVMAQEEDDVVEELLREGLDGEGDAGTEDIAEGVETPEEMEEEITPELALKIQDVTDLLNKANQKLTMAKRESGYAFNEATSIMERCADLFGEEKYDEIMEIIGEVEPSVDNEIRSWDDIYERLEKLRNDIVWLGERNIFDEQVNECYEKAGETYQEGDIQGTLALIENMENSTKTLKESLETTIENIGKIKVILSEAQDEGIDITEEMNSVAMLREPMSEGDFETVNKAISGIEGSIQNRRKEAVLAELEETDKILKNAPPTIDLTEAKELLLESRELLENDEYKDAKQKIFNAREAAKETRERYLELVQKIETVSKYMDQLSTMPIDITEIEEISITSKEALKNGDLDGAEECLKRLQPAMEEMKEKEKARFSQSIEEELQKVGASLAEIREKYPSSDIEVFQKRHITLAEQYEEAQDLRDLIHLHALTEELHNIMEARMGMIIKRAKETQNGRAVLGVDTETGTGHPRSTFDVCTVCKKPVGTHEARYLCGCNQLYHKGCAEKVSSNFCNECGGDLFDIENMFLVTCSICGGDVWYDDTLLVHDCGAFYHRDCILTEMECGNCYGPVDAATGYIMATCMVCYKIVRDDSDSVRCDCGEPYHDKCYDIINYCTRCGKNLSEGATVQEKMKWEEENVASDDQSDSTEEVESDPAENADTEVDSLLGEAEESISQEVTEVEPKPDKIEEGSPEKGEKEEVVEEKIEEEGKEEEEASEPVLPEAEKQETKDQGGDDDIDDELESLLEGIEDEL